MSDTPEFMTHERIMTGEEYVSYSDYLLLQKERDEAITRRMETIMQCELYEQERDEAREESLEQARLLGISGERECRLIAERDQARREILGWENKWNAAVEMAALAENERDRLRERLTNTEDQLDYALICIRRLEGRITESEP